MLETKEKSAAEGVAVAPLWGVYVDDDPPLERWNVCLTRDDANMMIDHIVTSEKRGRGAHVHLRPLYLTDHAAIVRERDETIKALREQVAGLSKDAGRYQFLRQPGNAIVYAARRDAWGSSAHPSAGHVRYDTPEILDVAIDAAIAGEAK